MKNSSTYIHELLISYQKVSFKNFGSFNKSYSINYNEQTSSFNKEYALDFVMNTNEKEDLMFAKYVALKENISLNESIDQTNNLIQEIKISVLNNQEYKLNGLGKFILDEEEKIVFESENIESIFPELFGINSIHLKPLDKNILNIPLEKPKKKKTWLWASAILLPLLGASVFFSMQESPISLKNKIANFAGFSSEANISEYKVVKKKASILLDFEEIEMFEIEEEEEIDLRYKTSKNPEFQVVIGVFSDINNANNLVKKLNKAVSNIIISPYKKDLYKVYTAPTANKLKAKETLKTIKNIQPNAWLLKAIN